ncbi:MAG: TnsD family transposase, partial [Oscillospiraceae bacterium]|nr:TnsD family transposase [Oscillospiraceae bacterium]
MIKTNGEALFSFFPTPYPDETIYSVLCRFDLRMGCPSHRFIIKKLFDRFLILNTYVPQSIGKIASYLPTDTMLTPEYLIRHTTMFSYFAPFISQERKNAFLGYMRNEGIPKKNTFSGLGICNMRQPRNLYLRFCESCWREDIRVWGEPYWHRLHQLPGILMCHQHEEPLRHSHVLITLANQSFYPASIDMVVKSSVCGDFGADIAKKLTLLSESSQWLLENGHLYGPYDKVYTNYCFHLHNAGYSTMNGYIWHNKIYKAINDFYGKDFLMLLEAYDENLTIAWTKRIFSNKFNSQLPMYHILLHILLTGSSDSFLNSDCRKPLPYGEGPWPCRNPICPHNLEDMIENIDIHYARGSYKTLFKCPHCGFAYRRQKPIPKEKQYTGIVYIESYGELWQQKLRECIVEKGFSAKRSCKYLKCSAYTVQKYAIKFGYIKPEDATYAEKKYVPKSTLNANLVLTENEKRSMWRKIWKQLVIDFPDANRNLLRTLAPTCHRWLRKNDKLWFEKHSPEPKKGPHFDWEERDLERLGSVQEAVNILQNSTDRPIRITLKRIAMQIGLLRI